MNGTNEEHRTKAQLLEEIQELRRRLEEAELTLEAIRTGDVDALVVAAPRGEQVYTLTGAEHVYRVIVETMNEAALTVDAAGTILFCNQRFCDLMKAPMQEVVGRKVTAFAARPQQAPLRELLVKVQAGPVQRRVTLRASDGAAVPVKISASLLHTNASTSICLVASDLTELEASAQSIRVLREQQQALEESESRFRTIFESSQDAVVITDDEGVYLQANPAVADVFGLPPEQLIGRRVLDFLGEAGDFPALWQDFLTTGSFRGEMPLVDAEGQVRYVDAYAVANILPGRHLCVIRDVTERRRAREALENANVQLQIQAEELTTQAEELRVANDELRLSRQALQEANGQFQTQTEELEVQTEELRAANEELAAREEDVRRQRELLATVLNTVPVGVVFADAQGNFTYSNPQVRRLFGQAVRGDAFGPPPDTYQILRPDGTPFAGDQLPLVRAVRERTRMAGVEMLIRRADGGEVAVLVDCAPVQDDRGRVTGAVASLTDITERKRAEEALRQSEQRYYRLFEDDLTGDFVSTPEGRILLCNPSFAQVFGFSRAQDAVGTTMLDLYIDPQEQQSLVERLKQECKIDRLEAWHKRRDGALIYLVENLVGHFNECGELYEIKGYVFDDTERKRAEEALRSVALFPEQNPAPTLRVARDGTLLYANGASAFLLRSWDCQPGQAAPEQIRQYVVQALDSQEITEADVVCGPITYSFSIAPIASEGYANLYARDITERERAEEALRESRERLERAQEIAHLGSWELDLVSNRLTWSDEVYRIFGLAAQEFDATYEAFLDRVHPEDRAAVDAAYSGSLREGRDTYEIDHRIVRRSTGEVRIVHEKCAHLRDAAGRIIRSLGMVHDITERKQAEEALRELTRTLEARVAQRTQELRHRAEQLQKLALELSLAEDRERKRLADILHDDLQQQLAAAKFHLQMLSNRLRHEPSQREVATKVDQMLKDAIEKSRSLSHELSPAVLYHGNLAETFTWLAGQVQAKHGLVVHVDDLNEVTVESDALKAFLYMAGQELLFNVVKHARVGEARIRLRRVGRCVCVSVSDHGRGFDPQELTETAGFGLFSIRERIELLGGRMRIKSAKGKGSTFHIVVPDGLETEAGGRGARERAARHAASFALGQPPDAPVLRILLADDHEIVREGLASLLAEAPGIEVVGEAANGREAINEAYRLRPDVVIMDVAMPLINGDEATRQIKMHLPGTRVIGLSMYDEPDLREKMRRAGAEGYVLKTAPTGELLAAIRGE